MTATQTFTSKIVRRFAVASEATLRNISNVERLGRFTLPKVEVDDGDGGKEELFALSDDGRYPHLRRPFLENMTAVSKGKELLAASRQNWEGQSVSAFKRGGSIARLE